MSYEKIFTCSLTGYEIRTKIRDNAGIIESINFKDYKYIKAMVSLMKRAIVSLTEYNIEKMYIVVSKEELKNLDGEWDIEPYDNNGNMKVGCDINDFVQKWAKSSGLI